MLRHSLAPLLRSTSLRAISSTRLTNACFHCDNVMRIPNVDDTRSVLQSLHFDKLTDLQQSAIPVIRQNDHVVIKAPIGTGKTLSYLLPALEIVRQAIYDEKDTQRSGFRLLVLTNSREHAAVLEKLVQQIATTWNEPLLTVRATIGGRNLDKEIDFLDFKEPEVIIATPSRLSEHLPNSDYFRNLKVLVVDGVHQFMEGDKVSETVDKILKELPKNRKTILVDDHRLQISPAWFHNETVPEELKSIEIDGVAYKKQFTNYVVKSDSYKETIDKLANLLSQNLDKKVAVFLPSDDFASFLHYHYASNGLYTTLLTSKLAPSIRIASYFFFKEQLNGVLLTTSTFEEIIHDDIDLVVNVGQPESMHSFEARNSRLKSDPNSCMVTFQQRQLDQKEQDLNYEELHLERKETTLDKKEHELLFNAYEGLMFQLSKRLDDKEQVFERVSQLLTDFGLEPHKTSFKFAEKIGMKDVLRNKNLLSVSRSKFEIEEKEKDERIRHRITKKSSEQHEKNKYKEQKKKKAKEEMAEKLRQLREKRKADKAKEEKSQQKLPKAQKKQSKTQSKPHEKQNKVPNASKQQTRPNEASEQ